MAKVTKHETKKDANSCKNIYYFSCFSISFLFICCCFCLVNFCLKGNFLANI